MPLATIVEPVVSEDTVAEESPELITLVVADLLSFVVGAAVVANPLSVAVAVEETPDLLLSTVVAGVTVTVNRAVVVVGAFAVEVVDEVVVGVVGS